MGFHMVWEQGQWTPLTLIVRRIELVKLFVGRGADVNLPRQVRTDARIDSILEVSFHRTIACFRMDRHH
jgi:hypothetical protein